MVTFGKICGGGLPIGVVAGDAKYLDALDGAGWHSADDSVRHPLALAAARAVLLRLKQEGPALQRCLNLRTTALVERLMKVVSEFGAPVQLHHFSSCFVVSFPHELPVAPLYHAMMREHGVQSQEGHPCFLTLSHNDADLDRVVAVFSATLAEMQAADFLPKRADAPRKGRDPSGREAWFVPDPDRPGKYLQVADVSAVQASENGGQAAKLECQLRTNTQLL
jgi:glutamate-1-semialdehyde aminotransferase